MSPKLKWKVDPEPTGRYRSFEKRDWPVAWFRGKPAFFVSCATDYRPCDVRDGAHAPLTLIFCYHNHPKAGNSWVRFRIARPTFKTLAEAKLYANSFWAARPELWPKEKENV